MSYMLLCLSYSDWLLPDMSVSEVGFACQLCHGRLHLRLALFHFLVKTKSPKLFFVLSPLKTHLLYLVYFDSFLKYQVFQHSKLNALDPAYCDFLSILIYVLLGP